MKGVLLCSFLCLVFFPRLTLAQQGEDMQPKCQNLAHEFADNPDSLNQVQLKQLQYCVSQTIEQRYKTNPPDLLRGTIIDPPSSSMAPGMPPPTPSQPPIGQE